MKEVNVEDGKIVLKDLKNLLHIECTYYKVPKAENAAHITVSAPQVLGYKFVSWINVATQGFVRSCYIDAPDHADASIWFTQSTMDINPDVNVVIAYALYVKE